MTTDLEPECAFIPLENRAFDFLLLGTGVYVRRELSNVIVARSIVLVQHLNPKLRISRHVPNLPQLVPNGL